MGSSIVAQTLVESSFKHEKRRVELTFVDADGERHTLSLPASVAADLAPVLMSLAEKAAGPTKAQFTKVPKQLAVASATHERLVLLRFDDEPPYGLGLEEAEILWRGLREETETASRLKVPPRQ